MKPVRNRARGRALLALPMTSLLIWGCRSPDDEYRQFVEEMSRRQVAQQESLLRQSENLSETSRQLMEADAAARGEMDFKGLFVARQLGLIAIDARQSNTCCMTNRMDQAMAGHPLEDVVALDPLLVFRAAIEIRTSRAAPPATGRAKATLSHLKQGGYPARKDRTEPPPDAGRCPLTLPVIDLFAGPGGLGEGFAANRPPGGPPRFRVALSIESDPVARETLRLRGFYRQFAASGVPEEYYEYLRGEMDLKGLYELFAEQAQAADREAWLAELGRTPSDEIDSRLSTALAGEKDWVLIGGPLCQAYSVIGRSRVGGVDPEDRRVHLYREYLRVVALHL